jgi:hypothetical protein
VCEIQQFVITPFQVCEKEFWIWIKGIMGAYDGRSPRHIGSIYGIYIFLQC